MITSDMQVIGRARRCEKRVTPVLGIVVGGLVLIRWVMGGGGWVFAVLGMVLGKGRGWRCQCRWVPAVPGMSVIQR